jgi:GNAT superfamily N-acetyltransferase
VELSWLDPEHLERHDVDGAVALREAARVVDRPYEPASMASSFVARLRHGWDGDPPLIALARDRHARVTGVLEVWLPHWDNRHVGLVDVTVDPLVRRQGVGRRLFEAGVQRTRADGRTLVLAGCLEQSAGLPFAKAMGLDRVYEEVLRRQDLLSLDWARLDREYADAQSRAGAYELVRIAGPAPEEMIPQIARMTEAINDAPTDGLDIEDEVFSPDRIRAFQAAQLAHGVRTYRLIAREKETGVLAGHTIVGVNGEQPWHGGQYDTSVLRQHRGHRLGLYLKAAMLYWLREQEPQLRTIDTGNAASNAHMIAINELLGYHVLAKTIEWQRHL